MIYLDESKLMDMGFDWTETIDVIEKAVHCIAQEEYAQPIKPYLRYGDKRNRIIAMPAFIGGEFDVAGIKWISSFPMNIQHGIPRAHSVVILNNAQTGKPESIINTGMLSAIRTASVSGLILKHFRLVRKIQNVTVGVIGVGPIGRLHIQMAYDQLGDDLNEIVLYDLNQIDLQSFDEPIRSKLRIVNSWQEAYEIADVFMTCTVSSAPYIDLKPKSGSLHLNVSLRDYTVDVYDYFKEAVIVDDWEEICRENTDIENLHLQKGLKKEDTRSIVDVVCNNCIESIDENYPVFFNPMGMAVFDIAIGSHFYRRAQKSMTMSEALTF